MNVTANIFVWWLPDSCCSPAGLSSSALREAQRRTAEFRVESERFARVLDSCGVRSCEEIAAECALLKRQAREAKQAKEKAQRFADIKANETAAALELAADLTAALRQEQAAKIRVDETRKKLVHDLRASLRRRAKAEQEASTSSRALQSSEAQRESLTQRLSVLRAANQRLEKRMVGDSGPRSDTRDRLAAARARLRTLAVSIDEPENVKGRGNSDSERTALERVAKSMTTTKKLEDELRQAEAERAALKSTVEATETAMEGILREKTELQEVNRILAKSLAAVLDSLEEHNATASGGGNGSQMRSHPAVSCNVHNNTQNNTPIDSISIKTRDIDGGTLRESCQQQQWPLARMNEAAATVTATLLAGTGSEEQIDLTADCEQTIFESASTLALSDVWLNSVTGEQQLSKKSNGDEAEIARERRSQGCYPNTRAASEPDWSHRQVSESATKGAFTPYDRLELKSKSPHQEATCAFDEEQWAEVSRHQEVVSPPQSCSHVSVKNCKGISHITRDITDGSPYDDLASAPMMAVPRGHERDVYGTGKEDIGNIPQTERWDYTCHANETTKRIDGSALGDTVSNIDHTMGSQDIYSARNGYILPQGISATLAVKVCLSSVIVRLTLPIRDLDDGYCDITIHTCRSTSPFLGGFARVPFI